MMLYSESGDRPSAMYIIVYGEEGRGLGLDNSQLQNLSE